MSDRSRSSSSSSTGSDSSGTSSAVKPLKKYRSPSKSSHGSRRSRSCEIDDFLDGSISKSSHKLRRSRSCEQDVSLDPLEFTHEKQKLFAERHGDFIISMMQEFKKHMNIGPATKNGKLFEFENLPRWKGGLYIFYLVDKDGTKFPIYVGQTIRTFVINFKNDHLQEHVFKWFDRKLFELYVVVCKLSNPQASFMKSLFLDVFNFIRNKRGSDHIREDLYTEKLYSRKDSWEMVKGKCRNIKYDLKYVVATVEYMRP